MATPSDKGGAGMMRTRGWMTWLIVITVFVGSHFLREWWLRQGDDVVVSSEGEGIVTLAPSTTEVVYALGAGEEVIGVSRFVSYPPEAMNLPKVGGYTDLDLEAVYRLRPKLVVLLEEQQDVVQRLQAVGIDSVLVDHASVAGILESISLIGEKIGKRAQAMSLVEKLRAEVESFQEDIIARPRTLLCIGRDLEAEKIRQVVAAGSAGYHRELITMAGGQNAYRGDLPFPNLTKEHLLKMNPEVIIEIVSDEQAAEFGVDAIKAEWQMLPQISAVRDQRVHLLVGDQHFIPGPRFIETLRAMNKILHP